MSAAAQAARNTAVGSALPSCAPGGTAACPVGRIRIGIFFDGTGNNMYRDWGVSEENRRSGTLSNPEDVDATAPTNVAKLHELYRERGTIQKRVYIVGIGSGDGDLPNGPGPGSRAANVMNQAQRYTGELMLQQATGLGGRLRIAIGMQALSAFVNTGNHQLAPEKRVAVFGFSRGAAQARDFINKVNGLGIPNTGEGRFGVGFLGVIPVPRREYPRTTGIIFEFLGIFDSVGSFGAGAVAEWGEIGYNFHVPGRPANARLTPDQVIHGRSIQAKQQWVHRTFHAIAEDEYRENFSLELVGLKPGDRPYLRLPTYLRERPYPGAHSDVGGGYRTSPSKSGALSHIPLKDMYDAANEAGVPLHPFTSLHPNMRDLPRGLAELYQQYWRERADLFNRILHPLGMPRLADYTTSDVVYLQALPQREFRLIQRERLQSETFRALARRYIHDSNTGFFLIASALSRSVNWTRILAITRGVARGRRQNSYDAASSNYR